jgi:hypothetical protein
VFLDPVYEIWKIANVPAILDRGSNSHRDRLILGRRLLGRKNGKAKRPLIQSA